MKEKIIHQKFKKMELSIERIQTIIAIMFGKNCELVVNYSLDTCYLFFDKFPQYNMEIFYNEVECLIYNDIIELDSGCEEKGYETSVYRLTNIAQNRINEIIKDNKKLLLKE